MAVNEVIVDHEVALSVAVAIGVELLEDTNVQVQAAIATLVHDPDGLLSAGTSVGDKEAAAARGLTVLAHWATEGGPAILAAPREWLGGVPC